MQFDPPGYSGALERRATLGGRDTLSPDGETSWEQIYAPTDQQRAFAVTVGAFGIMGGVLGGSGAAPRISGASGSESAGLTAGSVRNVNPFGCKTNCVNSAIATDATLAGRPASALPGGPTQLSVLEQNFGGKFVPMSQSEITKTLGSLGNGARGIVFGYRSTNTPGHVFNGVNQNGNIRFLDGQNGGPASWQNYRRFYFLQTTTPQQ
jgi:Papain fold toxin 1, glutamine deamidase